MGPSRFLLQPPQLAHRVDNGADPNETVEINDLLSSTSLPQAEQVSVLEDPELGYGGVAVCGTGARAIDLCHHDPRLCSRRPYGFSAEANRPAIRVARSTIIKFEFKVQSRFRGGLTF
jgi:hypothetical protein